MRAFVGLLTAAALALPSPLAAQQSPYLDPALHDALVNEISGDIAFEHIRWFTHYHRPMGGSEGFEAVARYVEQKAREYGLEDVRYITLPAEQPSWTPTLGELWLTAPVARRLAFTPEVALSLADYSRTTDATATLVDVGAGTADSDYAGKDVAGAVVLASGPLPSVMEQAVWKRGALGIVWFTTSRRDHRDQVPWARIPVENKEKTKQGTFAFVLSQREGLRLRGDLAGAATTPFRVRVRIESSFLPKPTQAIVEAVIRGREIHDQDLVLTGHLQEERFSANDDASGCANVLEIARALKRMIDDGRLPRPRRDIRFWWVDEISAPERYFAANPDERRQLLANINQDMVGARQSAGSRVQFVTRPPASRASFLGEVVESIVEALVEGNTAYLAATQARQVLSGEGGSGGGAAALEDQAFSRPVFSRLGTRERYDARVVPFHNNTDHQVFNEAPIGIPGVTFTNWPDDYIHSSDDDLWQMDATQLKRNAVAVAAATWFLAAAGEPEAVSLLTSAQAAAHERIARDLGTAVHLLRRAAAGERSAAWSRAVSLVAEASRRERRALATIPLLARGATRVTALASELAGLLPEPERAEWLLAPAWRALTGTEPREPAATAAERSAARRIPTLVDDVAGYIDRRQKLERPKSLHPLMAFEALNFVDGRRSYLDIARAVAAEADSAGEWYYGRVTLDDVVAYLDSAEKAGILTVRAEGATATGASR